MPRSVVNAEIVAELPQSAIDAANGGESAIEFFIRARWNGTVGIVANVGYSGYDGDYNALSLRARDNEPGSAALANGRFWKLSVLDGLYARLYQGTSATGPWTLRITDEVGSYTGAGDWLVTSPGTESSFSGVSAPDAPTSVAANGTADGNVLTWTKSSGATSYKVYRGLSANPTTLLATLGDVATYTDAALIGSTTYHYRITAINANGESAYSSNVSASVPLAAPTNLARTGSGNTITLTWTKATNALGYKVYRGTAASPTTLVATLGDVDTYADYAQQWTGGTYYYRVVAIRNTITSPYTADVSGLVVACAQDEQFCLDGSTTITATPTGLGGYEFFKSGVSVATQAGNTLTHSTIGEQTWRAVAAGALLTPESAPSVIWSTLTGVQTSATKRDVIASDHTSQGDYLFSGTDFRRVRITADGPGSTYVDTGGGSAYASTAATFITSWLAHDKRLPFEVEAELWLATNIDVALVMYPNEAHYAHAPTMHLQYDTTHVGLMGHGPAEWNRLTPDVLAASCLGKWVKLKYVYTPSYNATFSRWEAEVSAWLLLDGTWSHVDQQNFFVGDQIPHPTVALHGWEAGFYAWRNVRVNVGELSAYSVSPSRSSGDLPAGQISVDGSTTWVPGGGLTWVCGSVTMHCPADDTEKLQINDTSTNKNIEFPWVDTPGDSFPKELSFRASVGTPWKIEAEGGGILASGTSTTEYQRIDLSGISTTRFRPVITLTTNTKVLNWLDVSWGISVKPVSGGSFLFHEYDGGLN